MTTDTAWDLEGPRRNKRLRARRLADAKNLDRHTTEEWDGLVASARGVCPRCNKPSQHFAKDHIIPICMGGSDGASNLQPLCTGCNSAKGIETVDWLSVRGLRK